jgi:hypothetical protein
VRHRPVVEARQLEGARRVVGVCVVDDLPVADPDRLAVLEDRWGLGSSLRRAANVLTG